MGMVDGTVRLALAKAIYGSRTKSSVPLDCEREETYQAMLNIADGTLAALKDEGLEIVRIGNVLRPKSCR